jgi:hypothetical protein
MPRRAPSALLASFALFCAAAPLLTACPAEVAPPPARGQSKPEVGEDDPRVVKDGEDLYPAKTMERIQQDEPPEPGKSRGTGKPDETNGVCRLFAPELPDPECCKGEWGMDEAVMRETCGLEVYLGESFQGTCGYFFHRTGEKPVWARLSFVAEPTLEDAVMMHDEKMRRMSKNPAFASTPVPGVPGAKWSSNGRFHWAFVPGWDKTRLLSWSSETCSDEAMAKFIAKLVEAKQPPRGTPREGLVPKIRS